MASRYAAVMALILGATTLVGCNRPARRATPPAPIARTAVMPPPAPAEPKTAALNGASLYPDRAGGVWQMDELSGGERHTVLVTVADVKRNGRVKELSIRQARDGQPLIVERYRVSSEGVFRVGTGPEGNARIEPPMPVLPAEITPGASWKWQGKLIDQEGALPAEATFVLEGPDKVTTPAGSYQAYRVKQILAATASGARQVVTSTQWLAPQVWLVKQDTDDGATQNSAVLVRYFGAPADTAKPDIAPLSQEAPPTAH